MTNVLKTNLSMIRHVAVHLDDLLEKVVFLGGAATALLITDMAAPDVRITNDVDIIAEIASRRDYYRFAESLRARGFVEDSGEGTPLCRWRIKGAIVDVMPTDENILGFSNRWYSRTLLHAQTVEIPSLLMIRVATAPYFLATKIEAFNNRGRGDLLASHDMEDIVTILDGRPEVVDEVVTSEEDVRGFIADFFRAILGARNFLEALPGHLYPDTASQRRIPIILERIRRISYADK